MPGKDLAQSLKNRLGFLLLAQLQPHLLRLFPQKRNALRQHFYSFFAHADLPLHDNRRIRHKQRHGLVENTGEDHYFHLPGKVLQRHKAHHIPISGTDPFSRCHHAANAYLFPIRRLRL